MILRTNIAKILHLTAHTRLLSFALLCFIYWPGTVESQIALPSQPQGTILVHTAKGSEDLEGYLSVDLPGNTVANSWDSQTPTPAFWTSARQAFSRSDSQAQAAINNARRHFKTPGLGEFIKRDLTVSPGGEFALDASVYTEGDIVDLRNGRGFSIRQLTDSLPYGPMFVARASWSPDGKKLAVAGFHLNGRPQTLIEIDLDSGRILSSTRFDKPIESMCYDSHSDNIAVITYTSRIPLGWLWQFFGGHGTTYYDYYLVIYASRTPAAITSETLLVKDAGHGARTVWLERR